MIHAIVLGRSGDWADFLIAFFPLWVLIGFGVFMIYQIVRGFGRAARSPSSRPAADYKTDEVVCEEDPADAPAGAKLVSAEEDREDAKKWWAESPPPVLDLVLTGATLLEVDGKGVIDLDGVSETVTGERKFEQLSHEVAIKLEGTVRATFAAGGSARFAEGAEIKVEGAGGFRAVSHGGLMLDGSGKIVVERVPEVSVASSSDSLVFEASKCGTVFSGGAKELFAYDCQAVYAGDQSNVLATRCKQVSAQGRSRVYAVECAVVRAMGKSKVKVRKCPDTHRSDEAVLEPVIQ